MTTYQVIFYACFTLPCPPLTKKESCRYEIFKERKFAKKNVLFMKLLTFFWLGAIKKTACLKMFVAHLGTVHAKAHRKATWIPSNLLCPFPSLVIQNENMLPRI